jgi:hypothetical protein
MLKAKPPGKMLTWSRMMERHDRLHLVMGVHPPDKISRVKLLQRLIASMPASGEWAVRTSTDRGEHVVQVAFEKESDAVRLADTLGARRGTALPGWASQRVFGFPAQLANQIERALEKL